MQETQQGDMFTHIALKWSLNFQNEVYMKKEWVTMITYAQIHKSQKDSNVSKHQCFKHRSANNQNALDFL